MCSNGTLSSYHISTITWWNYKFWLQLTTPARREQSREWDCHGCWKVIVQKKVYRTWSSLHPKATVFFDWNMTRTLMKFLPLPVCISSRNRHVWLQVHLIIKALPRFGDFVCNGKFTPTLHDSLWLSSLRWNLWKRKKMNHHKELRDFYKKLTYVNTGPMSIFMVLWALKLVLSLLVGDQAAGFWKISRVS